MFADNLSVNIGGHLMFFPSRYNKSKLVLGFRGIMRYEFENTKDLEILMNPEHCWTYMYTLEVTYVHLDFKYDGIVTNANFLEKKIWIMQHFLYFQLHVTFS